MEIHPIEMRQQVLLQRLTTFASNIREGAQKTKSFSSISPYRVPDELRKLNQSAYTPRLIAIGPLHRNDEHLQTPMQHVKLSYTNNLLCRMTQGMEDLESAEQKKITVLQDCMMAMEMSIEDAKKCYAEGITLDSEMMLIDGCFILEFFYRLLSYSYGIHSEPMVAHNLRPVKRNSTNRDSAKTSCWPRDCLLWVSGNKMNSSKPEEEVSSRNANCHYHILHKIHDDFLPHHYQTGKGGPRPYMPSASELLDAGVKFESSTGDDLFKVKFTEPGGPFWWSRSARFEIPTLIIGDSTELLLRNFIAFEQCYLGISQYFTSYAILMEMLVKSDIDVQVLEKAGVVRNWLGASEDVTDLFNNLCQEVETGEFLFADMCNMCNRYEKRSQGRRILFIFEQQATKHISDLKSQYCSSPWRFIGLCVAIVYFGVTIAQLVVAIIK